MQINSGIEREIREVYQMDRETCITELLCFTAIPLDFTREYLNGFSLERLRHVLAAAVMTVRHRESCSRKAG